MDKIVDALFVFRGEGIVENFPGNYSDFRAYDTSLPKITSAKKIKEIQQKTISKNNLNYDEKREFGALEKDIESLGKRKKLIENLFSSNKISPEDVNEKSVELQQTIATLEQKEERWLELSMKIES
jgi:ATP-binding cassette subfamily F protein uup